MGPNEVKSSGFVVAMTALPDVEQARRLARELVDSSLAACVNLVPDVCSIYRWQGRTTEEGEVLLWIKTRAGLLPRIRDVISELHPYEVPELLALPVVGGLPAYLDWLRESTMDPDAEVQ